MVKLVSVVELGCECEADATEDPSVHVNGVDRMDVIDETEALQRFFEGKNTN